MKKQGKAGTKKNNTAFYSAQGVALLVVIMLAFTLVALVGMHMLGIIALPRSIADWFGEETEASEPLPGLADLPNKPGENVLYEALPREEYAAALKRMTLPESYYRSYTITVYSGKYSFMTEYTSVFREGDWWVQTAEEGVVTSTAVCRNREVTITDHTRDAAVTALGSSEQATGGVSFEERCGVLTLQTLTSMISALEAGEPVLYGGGEVTDYTLSFTPARGTGENLFTFSFSLGDLREKYVFSFESATILSAEKYYKNTRIYAMEMQSYANDLSALNVDALFK